MDQKIPRICKDTDGQNWMVPNTLVIQLSRDTCPIFASSEPGESLPPSKSLHPALSDFSVPPDLDKVVTTLSSEVLDRLDGVGCVGWLTGSEVDTTYIPQHPAPTSEPVNHSTQTTPFNISSNLLLKIVTTFLRSGGTGKTLSWAGEENLDGHTDWVRDVA
ncbi:hypothetical protein BDM02DRAFT_3125059 [Thelephora ganbajun]|uniref:Uncharacterized protein n=1 Tax=Thelephora ganbajun TaxID=370292 RepID=A0ACB6ZWC4_THEGA|nr:hypothetical protein BDM02DRAFT_3125059 [Thelephora ganbajun]